MPVAKSPFLFMLILSCNVTYTVFLFSSITTMTIYCIILQKKILKLLIRMLFLCSAIWFRFRISRAGIARDVISPSGSMLGLGRILVNDFDGLSSSILGHVDWVICGHAGAQMTKSLKAF